MIRLFKVITVCVSRSAVLLLLLASCSGNRRPATGSDWRKWFDTEFDRLPRWEANAAKPEGQVARSPDGLSLTLPAEYVKRNDFGCWDSHGVSGSTRDDRSVCVRRLKPEGYSRVAFFWAPAGLVPGVDRERKYEKWESGSLSLGGRRAIVERVVTSGGFEGAVQRRDTLVMLELARESWALLEGNAGNDTGFEGFVQIASTIQSPVGARMQ